jgi:hypothetical protein
MNDRDYSGEETACHGDDHTEPATTDPVEATVASYLDFVEGLAERPALDQLAADDRRRAVAVINSLLAGRGIELDGSTPSVETLRSSRFSGGLVHVLGLGLIVVRGSDIAGGCRAAVAAVSCAFRNRLVTCGVIAAGSWRAAAAGAVS